MIKKIAGTAASKILIAGISFFSLILNANFLGTDGLGTIGLIVLGITIILLLNNFVGGAALVYLTARYELKRLLIPSYLWAGLTFVFFLALTNWVNIVPEKYRMHVLFLALILSLSTVHLNILAGQERFKAFNFLQLSQAILSIISLLYFFILLEKQEVLSFIYSLYIAYGFTFLLSILAISNSPITDKSYSGQNLQKDLFKYGSYIQLADILQLMNYRLSYYFVEYYSGLGSLGKYTAGVQLSEGLWITGRSISTVQYASISNMTDHTKASQLSLNLMKVSFIITLVLLSILLILPESFYTFILGEDFVGVKQVMWFLSPGILLFSAMTILAHYFSGSGRQHKNTISSAFGLIVTIVFAWLLIPNLGIVGAAITSSLSIGASFLYLFIQMKKEPSVNWKSFLLNRQDRQQIKNLLEEQLKKLSGGK